MSHFDTNPDEAVVNTYQVSCLVHLASSEDRGKKNPNEIPASLPSLCHLCFYWLIHLCLCIRSPGRAVTEPAAIRLERGLITAGDAARNHQCLTFKHSMFECLSAGVSGEIQGVCWTGVQGSRLVIIYLFPTPLRVRHELSPLCP